MLIILDRDGVINYESKEFVKTPDEWIPIPGSLEAMGRLSRAGHILVVATNQSGVGRSYYSLAMLEKIHEKMKRELAVFGGQLAGIYFCPHMPEDQCSCRKPQPGLLWAIAKDFPALFSDAILVGDSLRDIEAAKAAGCRSVLVKTGNGEYTLARGEGLTGIPVFEDLQDFVNSMLDHPQSICIYAEVSGKVQGVFFRDGTCQQAKILGVTGWVKNLPNGKVALIACGKQASVEALIQWLWQGPPLAQVSDVQWKEIAWETHPNFGVR